MLPRLVATEEPEISAFLEQNFKKHMRVMVNHKAIKAYENKHQKVIVLENSQTGEQTEVKAEEIFIAAGRKSNADLLKVENTGVETDRRGWIKTNEYLETSKKNIWCFDPRATIMRTDPEPLYSKVIGISAALAAAICLGVVLVIMRVVRLAGRTLRRA